MRVCVGEKGADGTTAGGFNGGGDPHGSYGGQGGGATDFRVDGTGLSDRILVGGGGGGATTTDGGDGGGLVGGDGENGAEGGTQVAGGASSQATVGDPHGVFGFGGDSIQDIDNAVLYGAGGGGGWYGGGAGRGAGGGSSYIGGVTGGETESGVNDGHGRAKITKTGEVV